jgi:uncharacterized protein YukE
VAAVWGEQIRKDVGTVADGYRKALATEIESWKGDAAERYRGTADQIVQQIRSLENASTAVSEAVRGSGMLVATLRGIIRDLIAHVVSEIVIAAAAALASTGSPSEGRSPRSPAGPSPAARRRRARSRSC